MFVVLLVLLAFLPLQYTFKNPKLADTGPFVEGGAYELWSDSRIDDPSICNGLFRLGDGGSISCLVVPACLIAVAKFEMKDNDSKTVSGRS